MEKKSKFSFSVKEESSEIDNRKKNYLINKFNLIKKTIEIDDIKELINKLNSTSIENIKIETAESIFNLLDKNKKGSIITDEFIQEVIKRNSINSSLNNDIDKFFTELNQAISTTSEIIISKLKKIKIQNWLLNEKDGISDINWIINVITQENLYDLDTNIIQTHLKNKQKQEDFAYLIKYSEIEDNTQKSNDYKKIRKESKIYKAGIPISKQNNNTQKKIIRKINLNEIISPSIISTLNDQIRKIDTPEFNIFELNEILDKKTTFYIANEILGKFEIIYNEIIPKPIFKNFIETIVSNYDRINAIYHNDYMQVM